MKRKPHVVTPRTLETSDKMSEVDRLWSAPSPLPTHASFASLIARLDPDPYVRGLEFEAIARWFLLNSPVYRPLLRRVWFWRDWPARWGADAGIDLVAEAHD